MPPYARAEAKEGRMKGAFLRIEIQSIRMSSSTLVFSAVMHHEQIERPSDRMLLLRIEGILETAPHTAECVFSLTDLFAHDIRRQLVIFDELHAGSVPQECAA